jgi:hypothetical protein
VRQLIYIPIIHTEADMGSMAASLKEAYLKRYGEERWASHVKAIEQMWEGIKRKLDALGLDYSGAKLYQDGLPICGKELQIVNEVAFRGSLNHQILLDLIHKGCALMGTESPELLLEEYQMIKKAVAGNKNPKSFVGRFIFKWISHRLLVKRDQLIARRIAETLKDGETAILFMGIQHEVDRFLPTYRPGPDGFVVKYLIHRLPFQYEGRFPQPS